MNKNGSKAFTLIELMVVISIIALFSSIGMFSYADARQKAYDSKKTVEVQQVEKAILLYKDSKGVVPQNYTGTNSVATEGTTAYTQSMQELVTAGYLSSIPKSPKGTDYSYYASSDKSEAFFGAKLTSPPPSSSKSSCTLKTPLLPYADCKDSWGFPGPIPSDYTAIFHESYPPNDAESQAAYAICRAHGPQGCHKNSDGAYPNATCNNHAKEPAPGNFCGYLLATFVLYCKPLANSACVGGANDYCACIQ